MRNWFGGEKGPNERCGPCEAPVRYRDEPVALTPNAEGAEASGVEVLRSGVDALRRDAGDRCPATQARKQSEEA